MNASKIHFTHNIFVKDHIEFYFVNYIRVSDSVFNNVVHIRVKEFKSDVIIHHIKFSTELRLNKIKN